MRAPRSLDSFALSLVLLAGLTLGGLSIQPAQAQDALAFEPYSVYVAHEEVFARCGPSGEYYRTDRLRHGQALEVYAETDDGWLGIRPPAESFCWIPAETVDMDNSDESGTVIEDRTVAWIGTHLGRARTYRWQVQLAKGEPVTVLGRSEREGPDGPQLWYRIVPPSGEFRWVHRDQIVNSSEALVASTSQPTQPTPSREIARVAENESVDEPAAASDLAASSGTSIVETPTEVTTTGTNDAWNRVGQPQPEKDVFATSDSTPPSTNNAAEPEPRTVGEAMQRGGLLASVEFLSRPKLLEIGAPPSAPQQNAMASDANWVSGTGRRTNEVAPAMAVMTAQTAPLTTAPLTTGPATIAPASNYQPLGTIASPVAPAIRTTTVVSAERIAQIENETRSADVDHLSLILSRLMAAQATAAETEPIERAARNLAVSSADVVAGGRARELADRVARYRRVASRRDGETIIQQTGATSVQAAPSVSGVMPISGTTTVPGGSAVSTSVQAAPATATQTGYLVQVYSARSTSPPFALTDNTGRTIAYVTPSPGVNLRMHLNSQIEVTGTTGYLTGLSTPHIFATGAARTGQ